MTALSVILDPRDAAPLRALVRLYERGQAVFGDEARSTRRDVEAGGSEVATVVPDPAALEAMGENMMDLARRPAVAAAGHAQGRSLAASLVSFWPAA